MKKVLYAFGETPKEESKGIELTHYLSSEGWKESSCVFGECYNISYLGKCRFDGDMFAAKFDNGAIEIYKGHLNNGTY